MTITPHKMEEIKPKELSLGNFVSAFGEVVMVKGITPKADGNFYVWHSGMKDSDYLLPPSVEFTPMPLVLTDEWKLFLKVDKVEFPEWVQYVHQAQNYLMFYLRTHSLDLIEDWSKMPAKQDITIEL